MRMKICRTALSVHLVSLIIFSYSEGSAQHPSSKTYPEAIGFFAEEKTIGESGAALLKAFRDKMPVGDYVGGVQKYAKAKAAFDGLIRQLDAEGEEARDSSSSEIFQNKIKRAAEERIAFTNHIETTLIPKLDGTRFAFSAIFETVGEMLPKLVEAWTRIWDARRQAQEAKIREVRRQLEGVIWRPFNDVEAIQLE